MLCGGNYVIYNGFVELHHSCTKDRQRKIDSNGFDARRTGGSETGGRATLARDLLCPQGADAKDESIVYHARSDEAHDWLVIEDLHLTYPKSLSFSSPDKNHLP